MVKGMKINKKRLFLFCEIVVLMIVGLCFLFKVFSKDKKENDLLMPNFVFKNINDFKTFADENNINYEIKEEYNSKHEKDIIISQSVSENTKIDASTKVELTVSLGRISNDILKENKVNELGSVPVMMYHGIHNKKNSETNYTGGNVDKDGYQRTSEAFASDLEFYYKSGYRMIRLEDYVNGIIDVELGKSPIVITFDDGLENNIKVTGLDSDGNIIIDPNSAVGILESFKKKYPDYNVTATFFVNGGLFNQPENNEKILKWLVDNGYDVGNHSYNHVDFTKINTTKTQTEIGSIYEKLEEIIPGKYVNIVALPFGSPYSMKHANFEYIISGTYNDKTYNTISTLRVGWEANESPFDKNFNKLFLKRIRAYDNNGKEFDIEMNFKILENKKYISDGDKDTIVIKETDKDKISSENTLDVITY